jgi:DUF1009 family protein
LLVRINPSVAIYEHTVAVNLSCDGITHAHTHAPVHSSPGHTPTIDTFLPCYHYTRSLRKCPRGVWGTKHPHAASILNFQTHLSAAIVRSMQNDIPDQLGLIAGKGVYPLLLAQSAKQQGVKRVVVVAFRKETDPGIAAYADEVHWVYVGQLEALLHALEASGVTQAAMAGQITPTHLFRIRMDGAMLALLKRLPKRNAETIFGAIGDELAGRGITLQPASRFMEAHMPEAGILSRRDPSSEERSDIAFGIDIAKATSSLDIGQTVVVKQGTVLAVEAFEGTDAAILRAGRLGGPGAVVVKVAKPGHDMRFDIPVVGMHTMKTLRKAGVSVLAVEAGKAILLERERVLEKADRIGLAVVALDTTTPNEQVEPQR